MNPKVSVIIPSYNSATYISNTLVSVLNQTYTNIEIIVVDDGSQDDTFKIASEYICKGVIVVRQVNGGACKARNRGFELSTGDLILYLDADDILSPTKIEYQVSILAGKKNSVSSSRWCKFEEGIEQAQFNQLSIYKNYSKPIELLAEMWSGRMMMQTAVWLVPRELILKAGPWNESLKINQDGEFFCRVILATDNIYFAEKGMVYYRINVPGSVSNSNGNREKAESLLYSYNLYYSHLKDYHNEENVRQGLAMNFYSFIYIYFHLYPDLIRNARKKAEELEVRPPLGKVGGAGFERLAPLLGFYNILKLRKLKYKLFNR